MSIEDSTLQAAPHINDAELRQRLMAEDLRTDPHSTRRRRGTPPRPTSPARHPVESGA